MADGSRVLIRRPVIVPLDEAELRWSRWVGRQRNAWAAKHNCNHVFPADSETGEANGVIGAVAEYAVAKWLGHHWEPNIGVIDGDDVGPVQVRLRRSPGGSLVIRKRDLGRHNDDPFVLVTGTVETGLWLQGWRIAREVIEQGEHCDPGGVGAPCWTVQQPALLPMPDLLPRLVRGDRAGWAFV